MMVIIFTSDCSDFKKVWGSHFTDIIKTTITSVSATFENSIKVKKTNYLLNCKFYQDNNAIISGSKKSLVSVEKC